MRRRLVARIALLAVIASALVVPATTAQAAGSCTVDARLTFPAPQVARAKSIYICTTGHLAMETRVELSHWTGGAWRLVGFDIKFWPTTAGLKTKAVATYTASCIPGDWYESAVVGWVNLHNPPHTSYDYIQKKCR